MSLIVSAEAPSNIALIKYMGKKPHTDDLNRPTNASLSFTLSHLRSRVEILKTDGEDEWQPLESENWLSLDLSKKGQDKFLNHFKFLKEHWKIKSNFLVRSANNFPAGAGIASSASSFAALTLATYELAKELGISEHSLSELADLSRRGSGSSGRSLFPRYSLWDKDGFHAVGEKWPDLVHDLVVLDDSHKTVSSSEAHLLVTESTMFVGRTERAEQRLRLMISAFEEGNISKVAQLSWDEFWDMHTLFHTCRPPFFYQTEKCFAVLKELAGFCKNKTMPIVTMDAGANIHLLYTKDQQSLRTEINQLLKAEDMICQDLSNG